RSDERPTATGGVEGVGEVTGGGERHTAHPSEHQMGRGGQQRAEHSVAAAHKPGPRPLQVHRGDRHVQNLSDLTAEYLVATRNAEPRGRSSSRPPPRSIAPARGSKERRGARVEKATSRR